MFFKNGRIFLSKGWRVSTSFECFVVFFGDLNINETKNQQ